MLLGKLEMTAIIPQVADLRTCEEQILHEVCPRVVVNLRTDAE
jgi:hypothetical protein